MCSRCGWIASSGIDPIQPRPPCPLLRLADRQESTTLDGALEIVSLAGTLSADGAHLHIAIADNTGAVIGGHLAPGSLVRTTAELLVGLLPQWQFRRKLDPATGYAELQIHRHPNGHNV